MNLSRRKMLSAKISAKVTTGTKDTLTKSMYNTLHSTIRIALAHTINNRKYTYSVM